MFTPLLRMIRYSWLYAENHRRKFVAFIVMSFVAHLIFLLSPYVMGEVFNAIQAGGPDVIKNVAFWLVVLALIEAAFWAFHGPSRVMERDVAFRARGRLYDAVYDKLRHLPLKWHQDHHSQSWPSHLRFYRQILCIYRYSYGPIRACAHPVVGFMACGISCPYHERCGHHRPLAV